MVEHIACENCGEIREWIGHECIKGCSCLADSPEVGESGLVVGYKPFSQLAEGCPRRYANKDGSFLCKLEIQGMHPWCQENECPIWHFVKGL